MKIPSPAEILATRDINDQRIIDDIQSRILKDVRTRMVRNTINGTVSGPLTARIMGRIKYNFEQAGWKFEYQFRSDQRDGDYYEYTLSHNLSV